MEESMPHPTTSNILVNALLDMNLQDVTVTSAKDNRYLPGVVGRQVSRRLPAAEQRDRRISRKLLELLLTFGLPLSIRVIPEATSDSR